MRFVASQGGKWCSDCEGNDGADIGPRDPVVDYASDAENDVDAAVDDEEIEEEYNRLSSEEVFIEGFDIRLIYFQ